MQVAELNERLEQRRRQALPKKVEAEPTRRSTQVHTLLLIMSRPAEKAYTCSTAKVLYLMLLLLPRLAAYKLQQGSCTAAALPQRL